ncbi:MAG: rod-binding protein [Rhodospirillales bacterium]
MADGPTALRAAALPPPSAGRSPMARAEADPARVRRVAEEFEAFFLAQMLKPMFSGVEAEAPFGGGFGEEMWRSLQIEQYGKALVRAGGIGLADTVMREMLRAQQQAPAEPRAQDRGPTP